VQGINSVWVYYGNGLSRVHDGKGRGRRNHDDYVDIQSNHLRRELLEALSLASCIPTLNDEVATLLVAVFTEAHEQRVIKSFMSVGDESHPPNFALLLRERIKRPRRRRAADERDELAPVRVKHGAPSLRAGATNNPVMIARHGAAGTAAMRDFDPVWIRIGSNSGRFQPIGM